MTPAIALELLIKFGPSAIQLAAKLTELVKSGNKPLTPADFEELDRYAAQTSGDYLRNLDIHPTP